MSAEARRIYRFGEAEVDSGRPEVRVAGAPITLRAKTFQVLVYLLDHPDRVVSREELLASVWQDTAVADGSVGQCVVEIRKALGDDAKSPRYLKTFAKSGYRLLCPVSVTQPALAGLALQLTQVELVEEVEDDEPTALPALPAAPPRRWPWILACLALALLGVGGWLLARRAPAPSVRLSEAPGQTPLAVLFFENLSRASELDWLREGLTDMLVTGLSRTPKLSVLSRQQLRLLLDELGLPPGAESGLGAALKVAARSHASAVVLGTFQQAGTRLRVDVHLHDGRSGALLASDSVLAERPEQVLSQVDLLAMKLAERLGVPPPSGTPLPRLPDVRTSSLDAYRYYSLALEKAHALHSDEAIQLLEKAVALDPGFAMAEARMGYVLAVSSIEAQRALPHLLRAAAHPERMMPADRLSLEAWAAIARLDYPAAISVYRKLLEMQPAEKEVYLRLAGLLLGEEQGEAALEVVRQGLVVDPDDPLLYNQLAAVYSELRRFDEAIEAARRYVALDRKEPNAHDSLGSTYLSVGRYQEARDEYEAALALNPEFSVAVVHLGNLHVQLGRYHDALASFRRYTELARTAWERDRGLDSQTWVLLRQGHLAEAERLAREAEPHPGSWVWAAWSLARRRGDLPEMRRLIDQIVAAPFTGRGQRSTQRGIITFRGLLALSEGHAEQAIELLTTATTKRPMSWHFDPLETTLADAYRELGRQAEALAAYDRVLSVNPRFPMALYGRALALERLGRRSDAAGAWRAFLEVWRDADQDAPELLEARRRLAALS